MRWITIFANLSDAESYVQEGRMFTVRVDPLLYRIVLTRNLGEWYAFADVCPHKKAAFSQGGYTTRLGGVVCPLHQYVFDLKTGEEITNNNCPVMDVFQITATHQEGVQVRLPICL